METFQFVPLAGRFFSVHIATLGQLYPP